MPPNRTINNTGKKTIKIRTTGNEKNRVTVVLVCAGDGMKLKPMVIFKRKMVPKVANKHGVVITAQEKGWMDTERMKHWIEKVWRCHSDLDIPEFGHPRTQIPSDMGIPFQYGCRVFGIPRYPTPMPKTLVIWVSPLTCE